MSSSNQNKESVEMDTKYNAVGSIPISVAQYSNSVTGAVNETPTKHGKPAPRAYFVLVPIDKNVAGLNLKPIDGVLVELPSRAKAKTIAELVDGTVLAPMKGGC